MEETKNKETNDLGKKEPENKNSKKILLIEDDKFLRKIYKNKLEVNGFQVLEAIEGEEGIHKAIMEKPDLILLDVILPGKDGFGVLQELKNNPVTQEIPVVILSVLAQKADIDRALKLGAADYFIKSETRLQELGEKIRRLL